MDSTNIEKSIANGLLKDKTFSNTVVSHTKEEYFQNNAIRKIIALTIAHIEKYNRLPVKESLEIELDKDRTLTQDEYKATIDKLNDVFSFEFSEDSREHLLESAEKYYRDRALYNAIYRAIDIMDDKSGRTSNEALPRMMSDALAVGFDNSIGHDYFADARERHQRELDEYKIPSKIHLLNKVTHGGFPRGSLIVEMAPTGGGKSMFMSDYSAFLLKLGFNVAYFSLELDEYMVAERVDANLLNYPISTINTMPDVMFENSIDKIKSETTGRLIIKEFPASIATISDFRRVLNDLKLKKGFVPDVIFVDYMNLMASSRYSKQMNSYETVKGIAEELRGMAREANSVVFTATQVNRAGNSAGATDLNMEHISDSMGIAFTADMMFSLYTNEELKSEGKAIIKQIKNRFGSTTDIPAFTVGIRPETMSFHDYDNEYGAKTKSGVDFNNVTSFKETLLKDKEEEVLINKETPFNFDD